MDYNLATQTCMETFGVVSTSTIPFRITDVQEHLLLLLRPSLAKDEQLDLGSKEREQKNEGAKEHQ